MVDESVLPSPRVGDISRKHYVFNRKTDANGKIVKPTTHHVFVDEYGSKPGKYQTSYMVTQDGNPYANEEFDWQVGHKAVDNSNPVSDPIAAIAEHHGMVTSMMDRGKSPDLMHVTPGNVHNMVPSSFEHQWTPWERKPGGGISTRLLRQPGEGPMEKLNAAGAPLDIEIARRLKGVGLEYAGRFPGDEETDVYHRTHPRSDTFNVNFTVRHRPSSPDAPFSYSARRVQSGAYDDGTTDNGSSIDVTGDSEPVANLDTINKLIRRHNAVKDALGINRGKTAAVSYHCPECGSPEVEPIADYAHSPEHGHDMPTGTYSGQCNKCYAEGPWDKFKVAGGIHEQPGLDAASWSPHEANLMYQADDDLRA